MLKGYLINELSFYLSPSFNLAWTPEVILIKVEHEKETILDKRLYPL